MLERLRQVIAVLRKHTPGFQYAGYGANGDWARCLLCQRIVAQHALLAHAQREHGFDGKSVCIT